MKDYHVNIFYSDEDGGYIAEIPDLEACSAFGATRAEALAELEKARPCGSRQRAPKTSPSQSRTIDRSFTKRLERRARSASMKAGDLKSVQWSDADKLGSSLPSSSLGTKIPHFQSPLAP